MMEEEDDLLLALLPVFEIGLTDNEINLVATQLLKNKFISKDSQELIVSKNEKPKPLLEAIKTQSKDGWNISLVAILHFQDKSELATIVERCLNKEDNKHLLWILHSWDQLREYESTVKEATWMVTKERLNESSLDWLLQFSFYVANSEADSHTVETLITMLQEKISEPCSLSMISGVDSINTNSLVQAENEESMQFGTEVQQLLLPLLPLMDYSLSNDDFSAIARKLVNSNHFPESAFNEVFAADSRVEMDNHPAYRFVNCLQNNAKRDWKQALLQSIKNADQIALFSVVNHHLSESNECLSLFLKNWHSFAFNKSFVVKVADMYNLQDFCMNQFTDEKYLSNLNESSTKWLLNIVHQLLSNSNLDVFKSFILTLIGKNTPQSSLEQKQEISSLNVQAMHKEYVPLQSEKAHFTSLPIRGDRENCEKVPSAQSIPQAYPNLPGFDVSQPSDTGDHLKDISSKENLTEVQKRVEFFSQRATPEVRESKIYHHHTDVTLSPDQNKQLSSTFIEKASSGMEIPPLGDVKQEVVAEQQDKTSTSQHGDEEMDTSRDSEAFVILSTEEADSSASAITENLQRRPPLGHDGSQLPAETEEADSSASTNAENLQRRLSSGYDNSQLPAEDKPSSETRKRQIYKGDNKPNEKKVKTATKETDKQGDVTVEASTDKRSAVLSSSGTYADKAKANPKEASKNLKPELMLRKEYPRFDDYSPQYFRNLSIQNKYILEFRAVFYDPNFLLAEGDTLCVYLVNQKIWLPLFYDAEASAHRTFIELPTSFQEVYKYCIVRDAKTCWEHLPSRYDHGIFNRVLKLEQELKSKGHVMTFDVISMNKCDLESYKKMYRHCLPRHLPSTQIHFDENPDTGANVSTLHKIFLHWFTSSANGVERRREGFSYDTLIKISYDLKQERVVHAYVDHILLLSKEPDMKCYVKRILFLLAFATAMERRRINLDGDELKANICNGLSLHDIDEEHQTLLLVHLTQFSNQFGLTKMTTRLTSLPSSFEVIFKQLLNVPECILVFPLLKLINTLLDQKTTNAIRPKMPVAIKWDDIAKNIRKPEKQSVVEKMADKVLLLWERFPWMRGVYVQVANVNTVAHILQSSTPHLHALFDLTIVFENLLLFWNKVNTHSGYKNFDEGEVLTIVSWLVKGVLLEVDTMKKSGEVSQQNADLQVKLLGCTANLVSHIQSHVQNVGKSNVDYISFSFLLVDSVLEFAALMEKKKPTSSKRNIDNLHTSLLDTAFIIIGARVNKKLTYNEVSVWNAVSGFKWSDSEFTKKWVRICSDAMLRFLPEKFPPDAKSLLEFYAENFDQMKPIELVAECFSDFVTQAVDKGLHGGKSVFENIQSKLAETTGYFKPKLLKLCMKIFKKQWRNVVDKQKYNATEDDTFLNFINTWNPAPKFLRILSHPSVLNQLREENQNFHDGLVSSVQNLVLSLKTGAISVRHLTKLDNVQKSFLDCHEAIQDLQMEGGTSVDCIPLPREALHDLLTFRLEELRDFFLTKESIQVFVSFVASLKKDNIDIDASGLKNKLDKDVHSLMLKELVSCKPHRHGTLFDRTTLHNVTFFPLSFEQKRLVNEMAKTKAIFSHIVKRLMRDVAIKSGQNKMTVDYVLQQVWLPAIKEVIEIVQKIDDGSIPLKDVKQMFGNLMKSESVETAISELSLLYNIQRKTANAAPLKNLHRRKEQISNYFVLIRQLETAKVLNKIRDKLGLEGDFLELNLALEMGEKTNDKLLNTITKETIEVTAILQSISHDRLLVLEQFAKGELIGWLKEHMKDIGEVKVMSDLAMISAGETPMEIDRVSCFLSSVMGFSPLIFDLHTQSGMEQLLCACEKVWKNVQQDGSLTSKWWNNVTTMENSNKCKTELKKQILHITEHRLNIETSKHLEWLSGVKDFHGSVEKSSLTRAQMINTRGVYRIGGEEQKIPSVEDCLKLFLVKQEKDADDIVMSLNELRDLQSRLMLIAGEADKGKQDVNRFIDVLSCVETLTKAYVKLKLSGCLLFSNWRAIIRCTCDNLSQNVTVEVYFDEKCPAISSGEDVIKEVMTLTHVLYDAHRRWMNYLTEKRNEHYHLNHFNIHQLTYLCQQLANNEANDFPDQVYTLLACINENVSFEQIVDDLDEATKIDDAREEDEEISMIHADEGETSKIQKKKKTVRKLVQLELSENVAKAAVQSVKSLDIDECYLWGLENEFEEEKVEHLRVKFDEEVGFEANGANINVIQNVINDRSNLTLEEVIRRIQEDLEDTHNESVGITVKTVCERYFDGTAVTSLEDCISLEHLGQFLTTLGMIVEKASLPNRRYPEVFVSGKPNLIICPSSDIWQTILSIYKESPDQPLPSATEVMICSKSTTVEEVELLLRRAIGLPVDEGKRIYCLACADELPFNVAKETEEKFQQLVQMTDKNEDYHLVILTSSSQHYITSCFDENQVEGRFSSSEESMTVYLQQHLCVKNFKSDTAAKVDQDQSCVRYVRSERAGMGKSLFVARCRESLDAMFQDTVFWKSSIIRLLEKDADIDDIVQSLLSCDDAEIANKDPHFVHIDITPSVNKGVYKFLFDLIILGMIKNTHGVIWRRRPEHFYALEYTVPSVKGMTSFTNLLDLLPTVNCLSPCEVQTFLQENQNKQPPLDQVLMDKTLLRSELYQRPFQYLTRYTNKQNLDGFVCDPKKPVEKPLECLNTLLKYCSLKDPSWSELCHFSKFLNVQLRDCEKSVFCDINIVGADSCLQGFKQFVVRFMIRMSQDFATPSLNVDEGDVIMKNDHEEMENEEKPENDLFELHQLRRRWESGFHPYLFFNDDRVSVSFVHFNINNQGALCHPKTSKVIEPNVMSTNLVAGLRLNKVGLRQDFDLLTREQKLSTLCKVFGVKTVFDPDPTYELTTDNVLKMLAIHMRFRCGIPVVVMGETGCGKTRMIEFMSKLKRGGKMDLKNMVVVKVHGGITVSVIQEKVREALELVKKNRGSYTGDTILFLDEANTTEAIYAIKEILCDETVHGKPFVDAGLKIVAACNPYRRHNEEVIEAMEKSGLGFHVQAENVTDKFAGIPMRQLVYRVISLPPSMQPLVWDFGQLNNDTEEIYIRQMILKLQKDINLDKNLKVKLPAKMVEVLTATLSESQVYMREKRNACSFVSLRDVERTIQSFMWFYKQLEKLNPMIIKEKVNMKLPKKNITLPYQALIHSLGMCYHATLNERTDYREVISEKLVKIGQTQITEIDILNEIVACQNVFINAIELKKDIAKNEALRENVFMMIVCAEMRIPLFLVGKPGSSKSLAKTIVTDAMQGRNSRSDLFRQLKEIHVLSFQCSAVSDAVGIEAVFTQCAQLQKKRNLSEYVALVVLDEIGLAEDSPKMPLKVLHPLLETASTNGILDTEPHCKVGFVGISNWALDPAKMNRGIFVTRGEPSKNDLQKTAEAIFEADKDKIKEVDGVIKAVTDAYLEIYDAQKSEFFGLRDYYGLLKMIFGILSEKKRLDFSDIARSVLRNFSGYSRDVSETFNQHFRNVFPIVYRENVTVTELIHENLNSPFESRFLLLLTKQYSAVSLLPEVMGQIQDYQVIFGSSFPHDHDYTEVCRNINRIKVCMETGRAVVLLNLRDLYESLYDALNQHYVTFADQRYIDLGLGGHRVKCRVATGFRLIVIEEKEVVYNEFPIPLINRLEKYIFEMGSVLNRDQENQVYRLKEWLLMFSKIKREGYQQAVFKEEDTFAGYKDDTPASALLSVSSVEGDKFELAQRALLQTASLDGVCRLSKSELSRQADTFQHIYMKEQEHDTLWKRLKQDLEQRNQISIFEITSFSKVLSEKDRQEIQRLLKLEQNRVMLLTLQQFQTEQEYSGRVDEFFDFTLSHGDTEDISDPSSSSFVLFIQCPQAHMHGNLIACAKYSTMNKVKQFKQKNPCLTSTIVVAFVFTMERNAFSNERKVSFTSFHSQSCSSIYIDELRPGRDCIAPVSVLWNMTIPDILEKAMQNPDANKILDIPRLIIECIPDAMAKLQNQAGSQGRNRVRIMNSLCFKSAASNYFLEILLNQVYNLLKDRENKRLDQDLWIVQEACSAQSLQEGGSFRNTLWLRLRKIIAVAVAKIVSVADVDNNLDLLLKDCEQNNGLTDLWLQMFSSKEFCDIRWINVAGEADFIVKRQSRFSCRFPFCRVVFESMEKQWTIIQERILENKLDIYLEKVKNSFVHGFLDLACEKNAMYSIKQFVHDLVYFMYKSYTQDTNFDMEFETVQDCIVELFKARRKRVQENHCNPLVEVYIIFVNTRSQLQQFAEVVAVRSDILADRQVWLEEQSKTSEFLMHKLAFKTLLKNLQTEAPKDIGVLETCQQWKSLVSKVKHIADTLVPISHDDTKHSWKQIVFVEIFLNQLIPASAAQQTTQNYLTTLAPLARRLWIGASKLKDLSNLQFLNIITKTLQGCTKDIELRLICSWKDIKCKSCKSEKLSNPVLLPCQHYVCQKCVPFQAADTSCPICRKPIPNVDDLTPARLSIEQKKELDAFKSACTSFFLEYLSTFCFPPPQTVVGGHRNAPPDQNITLALEKLVICDNTTKNMTPLLSKYDSNPTARSYILQLLLRCDASLVENQLNEHFKTMGEVIQDKGVLMDIYIQCIQDLLRSRAYNHEEDEDSIVNSQHAHELLKECNKREAMNFSQIQHLDRSANLQYVARVVVSCIISLETLQAVHFKDYQNMLWFMKDVIKLCANPKYLVMQQYIVKYLCRRHGMDAFHKLLENNTYRPLIPQNLIPAQDAEKENLYLQSDMLVLFGEGYIRTKSMLLDVAHEADFQQVFTKIVHELQQSADSIVQILLALSVWTAQGDVDAQLRKGTFEYIIGHLQMHLSGRINQQIFNDISQGTLNNLPFGNITVQRQHKISELLANLAVTLLCNGDGLLADLALFITNPGQLSRTFLPTMPASNFFLVRQVLQKEISHNTSPKSYLCPNGHVYFIGECTNPVQAGVCPECHQRIGGQKYGLLHAGNTVGEITEESQAGYKLAAAEKRTPATPERKLTKLSVCAIRVCLHAAMLLGARHGNHIQKVLKLNGGPDDVFTFLLQHILKDLEELSNCLGRSIDDAFIIMHQIFHRMRTTKVIAQQQNFNLQSMAAREVWEEEFQRNYLSLIFKDTDAIINAGQSVLIEAGKLTEKPLERLIHELVLEKHVPDGVVKWDCPNLWKYRIHVDMQHLRQKLEAIDAAVSGEGTILKAILSSENLDLVQYLPDIFNLQATLIARYRQKIDMVDADKIRLQDYLEDENDYFGDEVNLYIKIWNKIRHLLPNCDRYNTPRDYFKENMNLESPVSMCLPSRRGRGCCALVLAEYLIDKQNNLLHQCRELAQPRPTFFIVDVPKCTKKNVICINENKDVMPLVLQNSQYETATGETGTTHTISYNLGLLEKKVLEKFILRKAEIKKETIPLMQYPQDMGLAKDYETVQKNSDNQQIPLSIKMCQDIDAFMENAVTANICEAVRTLTLIIQFLAKLGADPEQTICDYAQTELLLPPEETEMIPRSAQIRHCLALYERLSWHRSRRLVENGQNPFENVVNSMEEIEDEDLVAALKEELATMNVQRLQLELNALLMVGPEMDPDWSLGEDVLLIYLDLKYDGMDNSWCEKIPNEILFKNAVHVFNLSMEYLTV